MNAVIYTRISSREQAEGYSLSAQLSFLQEYAEKNNLSVPKVFTDIETAKSKGRNSFNSMLSYIHKHRIKTVLVEKTDRLYRNFSDYVKLDEFDLEIHLVKENMIISKDSRSSDKFFHGIRVLMAKNYVDNLSEEVKKGQHQKAKEGAAVGARLPYGYIKESGKVKIYKHKAKDIIDMFNEAAKGVNIATISRKYNTPAETIRARLKNKFYTGKIIWGGIEYNGCHEPIVSMELYNQVQKTMGWNNNIRRTARNLTYSGLFTCIYCNSAITGIIKSEKYIYYRCTRKKINNIINTCPTRGYIKEEQLEEIIIEKLKEANIKEYLEFVNLNSQQKREFLIVNNISFEINLHKI